MLREVPEGWQATRLGDLAEIIGGTTPSKSEARYWTNGTIAWATPSDVTKLPLGVTWLESTASQITEEALDATSLHLLPPGSVLMTSRATIGYPVINSVPMATNQGFANFLPNANYHARFLAAWIDYSRATLEKLSSGSTFLELSKKTLRAVQVALPPIDEQHRIADILASVDETIEATEAVIEQARTAKQGVLARLLTRGIKHTRFKQTAIGEVPEAWEVSPLSKVIKLRRGFAFKSQDYVDHGVLSFRVSNVGRSTHDFGEKRHLPKAFLREYNDYALRGEEILLVMVGATVGKIGRVPRAVCPALLNQNMWHLKPTEVLEEEYFWQALPGVVARHMGKDQGGAYKFFTTSGFLAEKIAVPPYQEQLMIGRSLSALDAEMNEHSQFVHQLDSIKTALASDLLTGRKRVTTSLPMAAQ